MLDRSNFYVLINGKQRNEFLRSCGLLRSENICEVCERQMFIASRVANRDGEMWQCGKRTCNNRRKSIRVGSIFEGMKKQLRQYMVAIYEWCRGADAKSVCRDAKIEKKTVLLMNSFLRRTASNWVRAMCSGKIGGEGKCVEIDETLIARRKFNRGRLVEQLWLFGGVERDSGKFFIELVPDRSRETLEEVILRRIEAGTTIISDEWGSYARIGSQGFVHKTVNHSRNFVDPDHPEIHTQTIESLWNKLKAFLRKKGLTYRAKLDEYLAEFFYRENHSDVFDSIVADVVLQHHLIVHHAV